MTIQLAKDAGKEPEKDLHSHLDASMLVSSYLDVLRRWAKSNGRLNARKLYEEALDYIDQTSCVPISYSIRTSCFLRIFWTFEILASLQVVLSLRETAAATPAP